MATAKGDLQAETARIAEGLKLKSLTSLKSLRFGLFCLLASQIRRENLFLFVQMIFNGQHGISGSRVWSIKAFEMDELVLN